MKTQTHRCFAIGCPVVLPLERLMCAEHTAMVPKGLARKLRKAFDRGGVEACKELLLAVIQVVRREEEYRRAEKNFARRRRGVDAPAGGRAAGQSIASGGSAFRADPAFEGRPR